MARYMKRNSIGRLVSTDNKNDLNIVEVRLSLVEYNALLDRLDQAEQAVADSKKDIEEIAEEIYKDANKKLDECKKKILDSAERSIRMSEKLRKEMEEKVSQALEREKVVLAENEHLKKKVDQMAQLNENLKRISRERANAARGLSPKKTHHGYIVLHTSQYIERNQFTDQALSAWKTTLQTPYNVLIPYDQVRNEIMTDLEKHVLNDICIYGFVERDKFDNPKIWGKKDQIKSCALYRWMFNANCRSGLWEITLYTTGFPTISEEYLLKNEKKQS